MTFALRVSSPRGKEMKEGAICGKGKAEGQRKKTEG